MLVPINLLLLTALTFHLTAVTGGRAQRKQRQAEESLRPYLGRVDPGKLCELLKCHSPVGSWCQVVEEEGLLVPKCVCPHTCPRQGAPVCSVLGKSYANECLLHKEACRRKRRIGLAHFGTCMVSKGECSADELGQFPYRLMDWFLLLSRMGENYDPQAPSHNCLSRTARIEIAQRRFVLLDRNKDGKLSRRDLKKLHYKRIPLEHCARTFFQSCDKNRNKKVTLREWTSCLVKGSEQWYQHYMSMKMGSRKLCPATENNL